MNEFERDILFGVLNRYVGFFNRKAAMVSQNIRGKEYPFVAMDPRQVFAQLAIAAHHFGLDNDMPEQSPTLLDVGCGIGNILLMAEQFFFDVYGIEKDPYPYEVACELFDKERIKQADIWNYPDYGRFDVIYYFRPFADHEPQKKFESMIEDRMRVGAVLIANHKNTRNIEQDKRFKRLDDKQPIWLKTAE